nr:aqualysin-1-like [Lytechinus pictus]
MRVFVVILFVALASGTPVFRAREPIPNSYIVKLNDGVDLEKTISTVRRAGGNIGIVFRRAIKGFQAKLSDKALELVGKLPGVEYIEENGVVRSQSAGSWGLDRIDAHSTLYGPVLDNNYSPFLTGAGVDVYVIDSGILDTHEDFGDRATQGFCASDLFDFLGGGNVDCYGHGTHCAGTVGSKTYGVATGVNLIGVKVIGCLGSGSTAGAIEGVNWVIEQATRLKALRRPSIAAMPLAMFYSRALNDAVDAMVDAGIETAVAAGNDQVDACDYSPGSSTKVRRLIGEWEAE